MIMLIKTDTYFLASNVTMVCIYLVKAIPVTKIWSIQSG